MTERSPEELFDCELRLLLEAVYHRYQHDFRHYAIASLRRRVSQAMQRFGCRSVSQLQARVLHEPDVFAQILEFLTVQVSEMFRDPPYWRALREQVLPVLSTYPSLKFWVAGCSAGEEVYSLAILLDEAGLLPRTLIYATDINPAALRTAEAGVYALERVPVFTRNYQRASGTRPLSDFYTAGYGNVVFDRRLRARVTFSDHSLATDEVFAEVHLISCRNVLIYFDTPLQDRAVGLFHRSLAPRGFLGLGTHERLDLVRHPGLFEEVVRAERLYRRLT